MKAAGRNRLKTRCNEKTKHEFRHGTVGPQRSATDDAQRFAFRMGIDYVVHVLNAHCMSPENVGGWEGFNFQTGSPDRSTSRSGKLAHLFGDWRTHRTGRNYETVANATNAINDDKCIVDRQARALKPIIHDDEVSTGFNEAVRAVDTSS